MHGLDLKLQLFQLFNTPHGTYEPHDKQRLVHAALVDYRYVYFLAGRQTGKTLLAGVEAAYALLMPHDDGQPHTVSVVSDKLQFSENIFSIVEYIFMNTPDLKKRVAKVNHSASRMEITLSNGASLRCKSSHNPTSLAGDTVSFLITDESGFVSDRAMSLVRPTLAVREGKHLAIGTADVESAWFKDSYLDFKKEGERYAAGEAPTGNAVSLHAASTDNPHFTAEELEEIRKRETARNFKLLYLAEFSDDEKRVFSSDVINACLSVSMPKRDRASGTVLHLTEREIEGRRYIAGVDIGRHVDFTVVTLLDVSEYPAKLIRIDRFNNKTPEVTAKTVASILSRYQALGYVDSTGVGDVYFEMIRRYYNNVRPFVFTSTSKNPLIENLVVKLEQGDIGLYPDEEMLSEFESFIVKKMPSGHVQYAAEGSKHDDIIISLALAAQGIRSSYEFRAPRIRVL